MAKAELESPKRKQNGSTASPSRYESPSRQVDDDIERSLDKLQLHNTELHKLHAYNRRSYCEELEARESALAIAHRVALEAAQRERNAVRLEAEAVLQKHMQDEADEKRRLREEALLRERREAEAKAERDRQLRLEAERLEAQRKQREDTEAREAAERQSRARAEAEAKAKADAARQQKAEEEKAAAKQKEEEARADKAAAEAKAIQDTAAAESAAKHEAAAKATPVAVAGVGIEQRHKEYLALYEKIKKFKNDFHAHVMSLPKEQRGNVGDGRRKIRGDVGKLSSGDKPTNGVITKGLRALLIESLQATEPFGRQVPVNDFLPPHLALGDDNRQTISALTAYYLALLTQQAVKLLTGFAHGSPERAEPIGLLISQMFSLEPLVFQRKTETKTHPITLFSIYLAKYHKTCPVLFGISGDQTTPAGKVRLGWQLQGEENNKRSLVTDNTHYDRMKGLALGYASIGLRNFSVSSAMNPYPPLYFWESLALIINTPPEKVQPTHMCVLRWMFGHNGIDRFLLFFGAPGIAALREAFVNFPQKLPPKMQADPATKELIQMVTSDLKEQRYFSLT